MPMKKNRRKERQAKRRSEEKLAAEQLERRTWKPEAKHARPAHPNIGLSLAMIAAMGVRN